MATSKQYTRSGPLKVGEDGRILNEIRFQDPERWEETFVSFSGNFGSYGPHLFASAPELLALLVESQTSIGGDWRERRDAAIKKATAK
jgi:hypothetical protein